MLAKFPAALLGANLRSLSLGPSAFENCEATVRHQCQAHLLSCFEPSMAPGSTSGVPASVSATLHALTSLSLSDTMPAMAGQLCAALSALTDLRSLTLRKLRIIAAMAKQLAASVALMVDLRALDVSDNRLRDAGMCTLCSKLGVLRHLATLRLQHNDASERGAQAVLQAVRGLTAVSCVSLSGVQQDSPALAALRAMPRLLELSR